MKIGEYSPVNKAGAAGKKKSASSVGGGDFLGLLSTGEAESASAATPASDLQSVTSMDALLSLQEMPDDETARRKAMQESNNVIEMLDKLRLDLLTGNISGNLVGRLREIAQIKSHVADDPRLAAIIQDIELRAAVELAKLERATKQS